jgi:hypothetical protein
MPAELKPLWQCPNWGATFTTPHVWHTCGVYDLEALFARSAPPVFAVYQRLAAIIAACGPVTVIPQKTRLVFQTRIRFVACIPRKTYLHCHFLLARRLDSSRFFKIETFLPLYAHHVRFASLEELEAEVEAWACESYAVGEQRYRLSDAE